MGPVLARPMFQPGVVRRETGSSPMGETSRVETPTGSMFPPGFNKDKFTVLKDLGAISFNTMNQNPPEKDFQINFDDFIRMGQQENGTEKLNAIFDMITKPYGFNLEEYESLPMSSQEEYLKRVQGKLLFNKPVNKAEGGEMTSDAVGIADGLDREEAPVAVSEGEGIARVSPQQYVELMNQVRGDEVPLEGRVQELAMTVGEKDAQETPLSVLTLVQPVFELKEQEQTGVGSVPEGQQMMQQQAPMMAQQQAQQMMQQQAPMQMRNGGIAYRNQGTTQAGEQSNLFSTLGGIYDPAQIAAVKQLGTDFFGLNAAPVDTAAKRKEYEAMLLNKEDFRNQAKLSAAPYLLQIGSMALDPNVSTPELIAGGAQGLSAFGTNIGKTTSQVKDAALKMALADKQTQENKEMSFITALAPKIFENALQDPNKVTMDLLNISSKNLEIAKSEIENSVLGEKLLTELDISKATLEKSLLENANLPEELRLKIQKEIAGITSVQLGNKNQLLQNDFQTITNSYADDKQNAELQTQLLGNINQRLINSQENINLGFLTKEKTLGLDKLNADIASLLGQNAGQIIENDMKQIELENFDAMQTLELLEKQESINKLMAEAKEMDFQKIGAESTARKEFVGLKVYKNTDQRYTSLTNLIASAKEDSAAGDVAFIFDFMRMVDPNSVVKEGEFQLAEDAAPIMLKLNKMLNKARTGERLSVTQRNEFLSTARSIFNQSLETYRATESTYKEIAGNTFGKDNVENIIPGIQFDEKILQSLGNEDAFSDYLNTINGEG
tara:strand:+ start:432 stop:2780 length:2349 start_codon:yes stop_codon:yes gene_type:complete